MKIERIEVFPVRMPMKAVLTLPRGPSRTIAEGKRNALVKITDVDGNIGWGESGPSRRWSAETLESCVSSIREYLAPALIGHDIFDIAGAHAKMNVELASECFDKRTFTRFIDTEDTNAIATSNHQAYFTQNRHLIALLVGVARLHIF